ncbi:MAG: GNAT family N-acetyltransferase [Gammaproteobacteria bacterium]|nr:GNAT family N-acetyltransferase [Gammaproteobacteria bacterium]
MAVRHDLRGGGIGKKLLLETERVIALQDDQKVYIETSSRPQYAPTHAFYLRTGYRETVVLQDFYAPATPRSSSARPLQ